MSTITKNDTAIDPTPFVESLQSRFNDRQYARLIEILSSNTDCMHDECFEQENAYEELFKSEEVKELPRANSSWYHPILEQVESFKSAKQANVVLSGKQERTLFLQFNYARHRMLSLVEANDGGAWNIDDAKELLKWDLLADDLRDQLAQFNLALVLAMAKKFKGSDLDFSDLISEGNMALLRAIDKFNASRGFKFSTYACRAILKAFSRVGVKHTKYKTLFPTDFDPDLEKSNYQREKYDGHEDDCMDEVVHIVKANRAELSDVELAVIDHRFAVNRGDNDEISPMTLEQVGKLVGLTKERVRQIQNKALVKIRETLEKEYLDGTPRTNSN